jgi:hypothetical protein
MSNKEYRGLWFVTTYYNPLNYYSRRKNFEVFYDSLKKQTENIYVVELLMGSEQSSLSHIVPSHNLHIVRTNNILWHKESLLNIGFQNLPNDCDRVCWIDCDLVAQDKNYVKKIYNALNNSVIVQCFSFGVALPKGLYEIPETLDYTSFPIRYPDDCARMYGDIVGKATGRTGGHPGYVWATHRWFLNEINGLYDKCILGGADKLMAHASTIKAKYDTHLLKFYNPAVLEDFYKWSMKFTELIDGQTNFVNCPIFHLYHGKISNRQRDERLNKMKDLNFDPRKHLSKQDNGLYMLHHDELQKYVNNFFQLRKEDK